MDAVRRKETALDEKRVISIEEIRDRRKKAAEREMREEVLKEANTEEPNAKNRANTKIRTTGGGLHRLGKVVGMAVVCVACVFAASMTSEANRKYLVNSVRVWSGDDTKTVDYNDSSNEDAAPDEDKAIADIEEKLGVEMPEFYYRPYGLKFSNYMIDTLTSVARMEYIYNDNVILLVADKENAKTASKINSLDGSEEEITVLDMNGTKINIKKIYDDDKQYNYSAEWHRDGTVYLMSGKIELEELKKIVENFKF